MLPARALRSAARLQARCPGLQCRLASTGTLQQQRACAGAELLAPTELHLQQLAAQLAQTRNAGDCYCLHGSVGAGKSVFRCGGWHCCGMHAACAQRRWGQVAAVRHPSCRAAAAIAARSRAFIRAAADDPQLPVPSPTYLLQLIYSDHEGLQRHVLAPRRACRVLAATHAVSCGVAVQHASTSTHAGCMDRTTLAAVCNRHLPPLLASFNSAPPLRATRPATAPARPGHSPL